MEFEVSHVPDIIITATPPAYPLPISLPRPKTAPDLRNQFLLALHKARVNQHPRYNPSVPKPSRNTSIEKEVGWRFPKARVSWVKPAHKFVRFCEKRHSRPKWNAGKLKPAFQVNALPLMSTIVANKASEKFMSPVPPINLSSQTIAVDEKSRLIGSAVGKTAIENGEAYLALQSAEKDEVKKLMTVLKATIRRTRSQEKVTSELQQRAKSVDKSQQVEYIPGKGHLRSSLLSHSKPRFSVPVEMEVSGETLPLPCAEPKTVTPVQGMEDKAEGEWSEEEFPAGSVLDEDHWPSVSLHPVVVVKISKGRNLQVSNTGLALDVDSSSVTVRSPESRDSHERLRKSVTYIKTATAPFGAVMKGRKIVETRQPGVRFPVPQSNITTPNHFLAGRSRPMPTRKAHSLLI